jgi:hypothetical protein
MQITPEQLPAQLAREFSPLYAVTGDEPLRALEAADAIRAAAKARGFTDRKVFSVTQHFDWAQPRSELSGMSLFGDRVLIDLRIPTGKPGKDGGAALEQLASLAHADAALLVTFPGDWSTLKTGWCRALADAGVAPSDIGYINAHATSTPVGDAAEALAFGLAGVGDAPVSSTKGQHGHTLGAAGAIEAIATLVCFARNQLPPNANLVEPDVALNLVRAAQPTAAAYVMSTGFGFGGHDSALIFKRV